MYCHVQDRRVTISEALSNYRRFVPKPVRKNAKLRLSVESLRNHLREMDQNPPGDVAFCKEEFLKGVIRTAHDYPTERYRVLVEEGQDRLDFDLVVQPMSPELPGVKLHSPRKKIVRQNPV